MQMIGMMDHELSEELVEIRALIKRPKAEFVTVAGVENLIEVRAADAKKVRLGRYHEEVFSCWR